MASLPPHPDDRTSGEQAKTDRAVEFALGHIGEVVQTCDGVLLVAKAVKKMLESGESAETVGLAVFGSVVAKVEEELKDPHEVEKAGKILTRIGDALLASASNMRIEEAVEEVFSGGETP